MGRGSSGGGSRIGSRMGGKIKNWDQAKVSKSGGGKKNPFSASAAMKLMGVDKNTAKLLKSGMFGF